MIFKITGQIAGRLALLATCFGLVTACDCTGGSGSGIGSVGTVNGEQCYQQTFQQPNSAPNKLDVLLVANTRDEENRLRNSLAASWDSYSAQLPHGSDFRVGVMLGNGSESEWSGRLWHHWSDPSVLHREDSLFGWIVVDFLAFDFWDFPSDNGGVTGQEELFSLQTGVTSPDAINTSESEGFFRSDAALAVVFISDVPDACFNPDLAADASPAVDCKGFSVQNLYASLQSFKGNMPLVLEGAVHTDARGAGFTDLIALNKGLVVDPGNQYCGNSGDWRDSHDSDDSGDSDHIMRKLGQFAAQNAFVFNTTFPLGMEPLDAQAFKVWVDQRQTSGFTFNEKANTIAVPSADFADAQVVVQYCVQKTQPSPTPTPVPSTTKSPNPLPSKSPTPTPSSSSRPSPSPSPTVTPTPSPTQTVKPSPSPSPTPTVTPTPSPSPTQTVTPTPSPSPSTCSGPLCGGGPIGV